LRFFKGSQDEEEKDEIAIVQSKHETNTRQSLMAGAEG
jgi:hypothetical protein